MYSLTARVRVATTAVIAVFAVVTALGLDQAFRDATRAAWEERLRAELFVLMGAAELIAEDEPAMPKDLPESRLEAPDSGLYARILDAEGETLWQSPSAMGIQLPAAEPDNEGLRTAHVDDAPHFSTSLQVEWEVQDKLVPLTFQVVESKQAYFTELGGFRRTLWVYLAGAAALLLLLQTMALRWGLRPLGGVEHELRSIERGTQPTIQGKYPYELRRLTTSLNALLHHERAQQSRYRDALADLAHSLKTPLAVLRGSLGRERDTAAASEQIQRMERIINYQLQRASTSGRSALVAPVSISRAVTRLLDSIKKVYPERNLEVDQAIDPDAAFRGSEDDLMELLGNLLDNAFKWANGRIRVTASAGDPMTRITVEDDGPGIPDSEVPIILSRGGRLDEAVPGQGIGLAVVHDIVEAYGGQLDLDRSNLGGLRISLSLPGIR